MDVVIRLPRRARGFSLIELITTTAVLGISLAVVVPSWSEFTHRNQITTAANHLLSQLRYARSAAVHQQEFVSLCPSDDGETCSGDTRGWHRGYLVFRDADGDRLGRRWRRRRRLQRAAAQRLPGARRRLRAAGGGGTQSARESGVCARFRDAHLYKYGR